MSNEKQETIADIVAQMRHDIADGTVGIWSDFDGEIARCYADLIEAAAKREREATREKSSRVGNAAKMREALRGLLEIVCIDCNSSYKVDGKCVECPRVVAAESVLSAPPRNCDRPECVTTKEAQEVWRKEDGGNTAYYEWLLATSTKGGVK